MGYPTGPVIMLGLESGTEIFATIVLKLKLKMSFVIRWCTPAQEIRS